MRFELIDEDLVYIMIDDEYVGEIVLTEWMNRTKSLMVNLQEPIDYKILSQSCVWMRL